MIVVDTNVLAYLYLPGEHTEAAEACLRSDPEWAAPLLWRSEFRHVLTGCIRRGSVTFEQACSVQEEAQALLAGLEFDVDSRAVFELVRSSDCSAYDCEFVAVAEQLDSLLVTMDAKLLRAFPKRAVRLPDHR